MKLVVDGAKIEQFITELLDTNKLLFHNVRRNYR